MPLTCAVPVLPATSMGKPLKALAPVPAVVTATKACRSVARFAAERRGCAITVGVSKSAGVPLSLSTAFSTCGFIGWPPLASVE